VYSRAYQWTAARSPRQSSPPLWGGSPSLNPFPPATGAGAPGLPIFPIMSPEDLAALGDPYSPQPQATLIDVAAEGAPPAGVKGPGLAPQSEQPPGWTGSPDKPGAVPVEAAAATSVSLSPELKWVGLALLAAFVVSRL